MREKLEGESGSSRSIFMVRQFAVAIIWIRGGDEGGLER